MISVELWMSNHVWPGMVSDWRWQPLSNSWSWKTELKSAVTDSQNSASRYCYLPTHVQVSYNIRWRSSSELLNPLEYCNSEGCSGSSVTVLVFPHGPNRFFVLNNLKPFKPGIFQMINTKFFYPCVLKMLRKAGCLITSIQTF